MSLSWPSPPTRRSPPPRSWPSTSSAPPASPTDLWHTVCSPARSDLYFPDPDVATTAFSILSALHSYRLPRLVADADREISACFNSPSDTLCLAAIETLSRVLAHNDLVLLCHIAPDLLDHTSAWWAHIADGTLDCFNTVSRAAFEAIGLLFQEFETKRMNRLTGGKLIDCENSLALRSKWVVTTIDLVWKKCKALMARSLLLLVESFCAIVFPLGYTTKTVASDAIDVFRKLFRQGGAATTLRWTLK